LEEFGEDRYVEEENPSVTTGDEMTREERREFWERRRVSLEVQIAECDAELEELQREEEEEEMDVKIVTGGIRTEAGGLKRKHEH
jgi:hypothetical protein